MGVHARGAPDRGEPLSTGPDIDWRARAEALEAELSDRSARANEALADAQQRTYWLDRLHLDLNALMARPGARRLVALLPLARELYRSGFHAREYKRRLRAWTNAMRTDAAQDVLRARTLADHGDGLAAAAGALAHGPERRVLLLGPRSAEEELRELWPSLRVGDAEGEFDLVVVDEGSGGLEAAGRRLSSDGRVLLATEEPAEAVVDRASFGWALLGRRRLGGGGHLYLLARA